MVYITPHARQRWRFRLGNRLSDAEIDAAIDAGMADYYSIQCRTLRDGTPAWTVRVRGPEYWFRAVLKPPNRPGDLPPVTTILHGSRGQSRGASRPAETRAWH